MSSCHWLHVSKGWAILLQWCDLTSSTDGSTSSGVGSTILSASNTVMNTIQPAFPLKLITETYTQHNRSRVYTDDFPRRSGRSKYFAYLGTYVLFVEQPVVSLWLNNRVNHWLSEPGWDGQQRLIAPVWKCMSGIGDHRFTFLMDLL